MLNRQFAGGELGRDWVEMREHKISSGEDMSKYIESGDFQKSPFSER